MSGCRALSAEEVQRVRQSFGGRFAARDRALFLVGIKTGFRISELLSLRVNDVMQYGKLRARVEVKRRHMKGKRQGRSVPLHAEARDALAAWLPILQVRLGGILPGETPVFCSRVKVPRTGRLRPMSRAQAHRILQEAFTTNELDGHLATHSLRKTFAARVHAVYEGDLRKTQKALGHQNINSTLRYLALDDAEVDAGILVA